VSFEELSHFIENDKFHTIPTSCSSREENGGVIFNKILAVLYRTEVVLPEN